MNPAFAWYRLAVSERCAETQTLRWREAGTFRICALLSRSLASRGGPMNALRHLPVQNDREPAPMFHEQLTHRPFPNRRDCRSNITAGAPLAESLLLGTSPRCTETKIRSAAQEQAENNFPESRPSLREGTFPPRRADNYSRTPPYSEDRTWRGEFRGFASRHGPPATP
jgi:hypothetical protein